MYNIKNLELMKKNFVGKVCSIFTKQLNRSFTDRQWREHFAVRITEINSDCIWAIHPYIKTVSCFNLSDVIMIQEEIELDPNNPEHIAMIQEYEKQIEKPVVSDVSPHLAPKLNIINDVKEEFVDDGKNSTFIDINSLNELANITKRSENFV